MRLERGKAPFDLTRDSFKVGRTLGVVTAIQRGALIAEFKGLVRRLMGIQTRDGQYLKLGW